MWQTGANVHLGALSLNTPTQNMAFYHSSLPHNNHGLVFMQTCGVAQRLLVGSC